MKTNNKIIAEFMGISDYQEMGEYVTPNYDSSWEWLMKAVKECFENGAEGNEIGDITHGLLDCNREATYDAVVVFIKSRIKFKYEN